MSSNIQEPSIEEQIQMEVRDLEKKNLYLNQMLQNKEHENDTLRKEITELKLMYEHTIAELCIKAFK